MCILVIDDEPVIRSAAEGLLQELGFGVLVAEDGQRGLELLRAHMGDVDAVILDVIMPHWSGRECFRRLKELRPYGREALARALARAFRVL